MLATGAARARYEHDDRDPLTTVREALDAHDCQPRGPAHKTTARCPAHDDRMASLSVGEGNDGRVLVFCHAGCTTEAVVAALNLSWADLFPTGHRDGPAHRVLAPPVSPVDLLLRALRELGIDYRATNAPDMWVAQICPACGIEGHMVTRDYPLWIVEHAGRVTLSCFNGCAQGDVLAAVVGGSP